jgi:protein-L-isoaspartate O-methyltransferase
MQALVRMLRETGDYSPDALNAMLAVDRGLFSSDPSAYSPSTPARIHPVVNMTAADLHAMALTRIVDDLQTPGDKVRRCLDVGTGTGYVATVLSRLFPRARILGIDILPELIDKARSIREDHFPDSPIDYVICNAYDLDRLPDYADAKFDVIHGGATAHQSLGMLTDRLAPGGIMLFPHQPRHIPSPFYFEELGEWTRSFEGRLEGPRPLAPVLYTPLISNNDNGQVSD